MNEIQEGFRAIIGIAGVLPLCAAYFIGGRSQDELTRYSLPFRPRIWKRVISPVYWGSFLYCYSGALINLISIPVYLVLAWGVGYGADSVLRKVLRRTVWAILYSVGALVLTLLHGHWLIFGVQTAFCITAAVAFGVWNPFKSASKEEAVICFSSNFLVPFLL
jgi:hypothetical protein